MKKFWIASGMSLFLALGSRGGVPAADSLYGKTVRMPTGGTRGMVAADDRDAAEWGAKILRKGGNAVDAAVATAFAMSVSRPHFASIGGGGFMVYCPSARDSKASTCATFDFRETAPAAAHRDLFIRNGKADSKLSRDGALASGVPGNVAGWLGALRKFGTMSRQTILAEPIRWARQGIRVSTHTERAALERWEAMNAEAQRDFGCGHTDHPCEVGSLLKQPDLARVLSIISQQGERGFYRGMIARKVVAGLRQARGIMTEKDLADYHPVWREPLRGKFRDFEIVTMPPPSSGGVFLLQLLGFMDRARASGALSDGPGSARTLQAEAYAMSLAFADRTQYLGDPAFSAVPLATLLSPSYLDQRWKSFDPSHSTVAQAAGEIRNEPAHTTSLSVIDRDGGAVAMTITVNDNFGSGFVPPGTGIVMNNQMDDFSAQPGVPNLFGLVGAEANSVQAGKRPLSSMTPTLVRAMDGENRIAIGAAGGPTIITSVFQSLFQRLEFERSLVDAVAAPRIHQQWKPATLKLEKFGFPSEVTARLKKLGYELEESGRLGVVHAIERLSNRRVVGAPDPRGEGAAVGE